MTEFATISRAMFLLYTVVGNAYVLLAIAIVIQIIVLQILTRRPNKKYPETARGRSA